MTSVTYTFGVVFTHATPPPTHPPAQGGLLMPSILIGSAVGGACGLTFRTVLDPSWDIQPGLYALTGATAMLGGVFRSTISLVVIMIEGTGGLDYIFPIIQAIIVSNGIGSVFLPVGVYERELGRNAGFTYLLHEPPRRLLARTAADIMAGPVECFRTVESLARVQEARLCFVVR